MNNRVYNSKININKEKLINFFEKRSMKYSDENPLISIMYQDNNPEIAIKRDEIEKEKIKPLLNFKEDSVVLDVGCGIGRWADPVCSIIKEYHGTDFSSELIKLAKERFTKYPNVHFYQADYTQTPQLLTNLKGKLTHLIICGVFPYINDQELVEGLRNLVNLCGDGAYIYIKSPVAGKDRLTLNDFWSEELQDNYSAIYRSYDEYMQIFKKLIVENGFEMTVNEELGEGFLRNRQETWQNLFVFKRGV